MQSAVDKFYEFENDYLKEINRGETYDNFKDEINACVLDLKEKLSENLYPLLDEIVYLFFNMSEEAEKATYKAGFKRGIALVMEAVKT